MMERIRQDWGGLSAGRWNVNGRAMERIRQGGRQMTAGWRSGNGRAMGRKLVERQWNLYERRDDFRPDERMTTVNTGRERRSE